MRYSISLTLCVLTAIVVAMAGCSPKPELAQPTDTIGIYLLQEPKTWFEIRDTWPIQKLADKPIVSQADILSYTAKDHTITLTPEAMSRLQGSLTGLSTAFVMMVNQEGIYLGTLVSPLSSHSIPLPSIVPDNLGDTNIPPNTVRIRGGYPGLGKGATDARHDSRLYQALERLGKLK